MGCKIPDEGPVPPRTDERLHMNLHSRVARGGLALLAAGAIATGVSACGSSSSTDTTSTPAASTAASSTATTGSTATASQVDVTLGSPEEFSLVPASPSVAAGTVTFKIKNAGTMVHEMVVIKTTKDAGKLPIKDGEAVETGALGETGDMEAGTTRDITLKLTPGHYALICNLPGHYVGGMYANFEVK